MSDAARVIQTIFNFNGGSMPRPPNYKQNKQRREDARKKRNEESQARKAARKAQSPDNGAVDTGQPPSEPQERGSD
jgi:hypothetical protein